MNEWQFKRLARSGEKCWDDVIRRFINEMLKRDCKTPKKDLEWLLLNYYALPNSPALLTAGDDKFFASACSATLMNDSLIKGDFSIMEVLGWNSALTQAGVGCGQNFSKLRSAEETVKGKSNITGGPVSFMKAYNGFLREMTQNGRKAANMGVLHVSHPDIEKFIRCKEDDGDLECYNISAIINDEFLNAVKNDDEFDLKYITSDKTKSVKAKYLFNLIVDYIYETGDPGILFEDNIRRDYFTNKINILLNPCGESVMDCSYEEGDKWLELCVLGSINLPKYAALNKKDRKKVVHILTSMLNDIIDIQDYVFDLQRKGMKEKNRKIGIGIAGLATQLAKDGIKYSEGYDYSKGIFSEIESFAREKSSEMGDINGLGRYNSSLMSQAPTSTLSQIFNDINEEGCSYGNEPYFTLEPLIVTNSFGKFEIKEKIIDYLKGNTKYIETANELSWKSHVDIVKAFYDAGKGKKSFMGCSKTINFRDNVKKSEIKDCIFYCWESGVKGITLYRDGSKSNQVLSTKDSYSSDKWYKRPKELPCEIHHTTVKGEKWIVLVGLKDEIPFEVFAGRQENAQINQKYKKGKIVKIRKKKYNLEIEESVSIDIIKNFENFDNEDAMTRFISLSLRNETPIGVVIDQLNKSKGDITSLIKALSRVLKKYMKDEESELPCPECGEKMRYIQGCLLCVCGYSKCS